MEENKDKNAELQAEREKLRAELQARLKMQRAQDAKTVVPKPVEAEEKPAEAEEKPAEAEEKPAEAEEKPKEAEEKPAETEEKPAEADPDIEPETETEPEETAASPDEKQKKKKRILNIVYDVLIVVGVCLLLYGGYSIYQDYISSKESKESYKDLENNYVKNPNAGVGDSTEGDSTENTKPKEWYEQVWVDLEGLQTQVNEDIVGWIYFENEDISYPILYSPDNNEYDRVRYDLVYAMCGSITLEAENSWDFSDIRNIIYGHNMRDLSMFGKLKYYKEEGYYEDHQYFQLIYDGMVYRYQIFSYFDVEETEVSFVTVNFGVNNTYEAFLEKLQSRAMHETGVEVSADDKTVTLLTCADDKTKRFLVNAVLVDEHVMANADGTYPDTESESDEPGTDVDDPGTEPDTVEPGTEPDDRFEQKYTYTEVNKTMWATTGVKIRNQPSADSVRMGYLAKGQAVQVLAVCNENGWYRVQMKKGVGYVNGSYLTDVDPHVHTEVPGGTAEAHTKCESCGAILSAEHVFVDEVITPATATTPGEMKHTCSCGYSYTSEIPAGTVTPTPGETGTETEGPTEPETPSESEPTEPEVPSESEEPSEPETTEPDSGSESTEPTEPETPSESESQGTTESETSSETGVISEPETTE